MALLEPGARVHLIGIGGVMMSAIARLLARQGCRVSGSDQRPGDLTAALQAEGIPVAIGHAAANVPSDVSVVARSSAIPDDNAEVAAARAAGVPVLKRADVLGEVVNARRGIAIAGTHGKTTTCSLAATVLVEAGVDPTFLIGTLVALCGTNCRVGGEWVIVEADEYDRALLTLRPEVAVVLNVEHDHPDIYADLDDVLATMRRFVGQTRADGLVLLGADSPAALTLRQAGAAPVQTFGEAEQADWRVTEFVAQGEGVQFRLSGPGGWSAPVRLPALGRHNAVNAAAAVALAAHVGVAPAVAVAMLARYRGAERRLECLARRDGITVLNDYAHHPTEVRATIAAARALPGRLRVVYEPHQFARTRALLAGYAGAFEAADETLIVPIYQARETDTSGVDAAAVASAAGRGAVAVGSFEEAGERLWADRAGEQVWLLMGAGDITHLARALAARLGAGA